MVSFTGAGSIGELIEIEARWRMDAVEDVRISSNSDSSYRGNTKVVLKFIILGKLVCQYVYLITNAVGRLSAYQGVGRIVPVQ